MYLPNQNIAKVLKNMS